MEQDIPFHLQFFDLVDLKMISLRTTAINLYCLHEICFIKKLIHLQPTSQNRGGENKNERNETLSISNIRYLKTNLVPDVIPFFSILFSHCFFFFLSLLIHQKIAKIFYHGINYITILNILFGIFACLFCFYLERIIIINGVQEKRFYLLYLKNLLPEERPGMHLRAYILHSNYIRMVFFPPLSSYIILFI